MKKNYMALFLAICLLIGLFSACGGAAAPSSAAPESAAEAASATEAVEEAAPAVEAAEAGSTEEAAPVEEGSLLEDAGDGVPYEDTFEEGAGVWPICDPGEKTITIWDGWFPFFSAFFESFADTLFFQEMEARTGVKTEFTLVNAEQAAEQFIRMAGRSRRQAFLYGHRLVRGGLQDALRFNEGWIDSGNGPI